MSARTIAFEKHSLSSGRERVMSPFREGKIFAVVVLTVLLTIAGVLIGSDALAVPTLQLDIGGGVYDPDTESIVSTSGLFTLYAILHPGGASTLSTTYYISAALSPEVGVFGVLILAINRTLIHLGW